MANKDNESKMDELTQGQVGEVYRAYRPFSAGKGASEAGEMKLRKALSLRSSFLSPSRVFNQTKRLGGVVRP